MRTPTAPRNIRVGDHVVHDVLGADMRVSEVVRRVGLINSLSNGRYFVFLDGVDERLVWGARDRYLVTDEPAVEANPTRFVSMPEPTRGSVVMMSGPTGSAYQRSHADGLWYGAMTSNRHGIHWAVLLTRQVADPILVWDTAAVEA